MAKAHGHEWEFRARFRRHAFGWKSQPAIARIRAAVSEIRKVARKDPLTAAEGAVLLLEKLSPAIEHVDSSSGSIGTAVCRAIDALVDVIAGAPADAATRDGWLERLWAACEADEVPYLESMGDRWGELCASAEVASRWADRLLDATRRASSRDAPVGSYFKGTSHCLSALLAAGRNQDILDLIGAARPLIWGARRYGAKALAAMGRPAEAIRYAVSGGGRNDDPVDIARVCEEILLAAGQAEEAYAVYGLDANRAGTHLAWFRAVARKYPHKKPAEILADLVAETPGDEGKWFAAAKDAGLFDEAIALARRAPCSPQTLTRAARDFADERPAFALEAGMAALRWLVEGYGYQVTGLDVREAYSHTMRAAGNAGCAPETRSRIRELVASETFGERFVTRILGRELGLT